MKIKIIHKKKSIKTNTLNKKTKTYDKKDENIQIKNDIEVTCEKLNIKNKRTFNDTNIEIKGIIPEKII